MELRSQHHARQCPLAGDREGYTALWKSKAILVRGRGDPKNCEMLRIPHSLDSRLTDCGKIVGLRAGRALLLRYIFSLPGIHFC
jgi:hypothetical protein